jgi:hypothetical protein
MEFYQSNIFYSLNEKEAMKEIEFTKEELELTRDRLTLRLLQAKHSGLYMKPSEREQCENILKKVEAALTE